MTKITYRYADTAPIYGETRPYDALTADERAWWDVVLARLQAVADAQPAQPLQRTGVAREQLRVRKEAAFAQFRQRYAQLRESWGGHAGYDGWIARSNNAALAALAD